MPTSADVNKTLREVIGESVNNQAHKKSDDKSSGNSEQTQSGEKPEFVSGIDISDIPEPDRARFKEKLEKKAKLLEDGYQLKFKEIAGFKKERDDLKKLGLSDEEATKVLREHLSKKTDPSKTTDVKKDAKRLIDQMKEEAPDLETRKGLEKLEGIILELTNIKEIKDKVDQMEKLMGYVNNREISSREDNINKALDGLEDKYGKTLIDKYREDVVKQGKNYTDADKKVKNILHAIVDPDELEQAILETKKVENKKDNRQKEKINAIDSSSSGQSGSSKDTVDIRKSSLKSIIASVISKKK